MFLILYGCIFAMFDFTINIGNLGVGVLPDFVGFLLLIKGTGHENFKDTKAFETLKKVLVPMVAISLAMYVLTIFNIFEGTTGTAVTLAYSALKYLVQYLLIRAFIQLEKETGIDLCTRKMTTWLIASIVLVIISYLGFISNIFVLVGMLGVLFVTALYLIQVYDAAMNFKEKVMIDR